jgi:hypothetical protein
VKTILLPLLSFSYWNPLGFLSHIKCRTNDDRFPLSLWETWFCSTLGVSIPALIGSSQWCSCNVFQYDSFGDHLQTSQGKSVASQVHKITLTTGKERDDLEIKDYVVLEKPQEQDDRLPPPRTLILDFTLTHKRYGSSHVHTTGQVTNTRSSDDAPESDGSLQVVDRKMILHYLQWYINRPDPIAFLSVVVDTTGLIYDDFSRLLFLYDNRSSSALTNEIAEESDQFRFLCATWYVKVVSGVDFGEILVYEDFYTD